MCVVIGLQSTGEANTTQVREQSGDVLEDFVSAPQQILLHFLDRHWPTIQKELVDSEIDRLHAQVCLMKLSSESICEGNMRRSIYMYVYL